MDLGMALTLIGTLTGVASVLVAVVQMRQSPTPALEGESGRVHGNGTDEDRRIPASDDSLPEPSPLSDPQAHSVPQPADLGKCMAGRSYWPG